jgi:arylsulfatase A-like enzyme
VRACLPITCIYYRNCSLRHLDQLVKDGMRFVSMYSSSPVCSPSRSSVLTGRFMTRNGVWPGVFSPSSIGGLALNETTLPSLLREAGYETWMAGKCKPGSQTGPASKNPGDVDNIMPESALNVRALPRDMQGTSVSARTAPTCPGIVGLTTTTACRMESTCVPR